MTYIILETQIKTKFHYQKMLFQIFGMILLKI